MEDDKVMDLLEAAERLEAVMASLEQTAERLRQQPVGPIVATVEEPTVREQELERRLAEAEAQLAQLSKSVQLSAQAAVPAQVAGRRTLAPGTAALLAKQGVAVDAMGSAGGVVLEAAALDGALASLSIEQRIAVKAEMLRAGLLG
jgi:hypothetical protein